MRGAAKLAIWFSAFGVTLLAILLFQLVFLPIIAPAWHAGSGLLVGGDWLGYHREAIELSETIRADGWSSWTLRFRGHTVSGILGAIYAVVGPRPWAFAPIVAALQAVSFLAMVIIVGAFTGNETKPVLAALPLLFFPSSLLWTLMPLKDGISTCGFMLFLLGWFLVLRIIRGQQVSLGKAISATLCFVGGAGLVWIARPYMLILFQTLGAICAVILSLRLAYLTWRRHLSWLVAEVTVVVLIVGLAIPTFFPTDAPTHEWKIIESGSEAYSGDVDVRTDWERSTWLPTGIDTFFHVIADQRDHSRFGYPDAGSNIDVDVGFSSAGQVLAYAPRALQIALFAPFPHQWIPGKSSGEGLGGLMRAISGLEMAFAYFIVPFFLIGLWHWRRRVEALLVLALCGAALIIQPLFVANVGTIMRLRYPYHITLVCLGFGALLQYGPSIARRIRSLVIR